MISFVIVSYKDRDNLINLILSIKKLIELSLDYEIIIVDNATDLELEKEIKSKFNDVKYYSLMENVGYGKAANYGVEKSNFEVIGILNADVEFLKGSIKDIYDRLLKEKGIGLIGPKIITENQKIQISWGVKPTVFNEFIIKIRDFSYKKNILNKYIDEIAKKEFYTEWLTGACFFMRKEVWKELNGFDTRYFLYFEDIDLCIRLWNCGYKVLYYPYLEVKHYLGVSKKQILSKANIEAKKSQLYFYSKHNKKMQINLLKIYLIFKYYLILYYFKLVESKNKEKINTVKGIIDVIKNFKV